MLSLQNIPFKGKAHHAWTKKVAEPQPLDITMSRDKSRIVISETMYVDVG
jgi:hypothetical protein